MVMVFDCLPIFPGIGGQVERKSEALELCPRLCLVKRIARNGAFSWIAGKWAGAGNNKGFHHNLLRIKKDHLKIP